MGAGCSLFEIAVNKEERFLIGGNNVFAGGSSPLALGWPHNKSTCLSHTALYFSLFILMEANKTPASNEHSQRSFSLAGRLGKPVSCFPWRHTHPYQHQWIPGYVLLPCCLCNDVSPQGCSTCPHLRQAQPKHGIRKGIIGALQCLSGLCQKPQGPYLSFLTRVFMTPDSTDFMGLGHPSFPCRNAVFAGAVCVCCPSSISPAKVLLS